MKKNTTEKMIPVTRNCNSCILCDDVIGCRLTGNISPARCVFNGFAYYKKGKQLFYCERCGTNSVTSLVTGFMQVPPDPRITFWCEKCDDCPIIEGEEYRGYKVEGIIFTNRMNSHLERKKEKKNKNTRKEPKNMVQRKGINLDEEHEDKNISIENHYIDPDDLEYCEYGDIVDTIEENGWIRISSAGLSPITHFNNDIIHIKPTKRNTYESILEIICPPGNIIAMCGFNQEDIDKNDFFDSPNLYTIPHFFTIRLADDNNNEIPYTTIIGMSRIARNGDVEKLYEEFYGDLCPAIDGKLKKKEDRYYFAETIILQSGEKLVFHAYWPFIDIAKIELLMMTDFFVRE